MIPGRIAVVVTCRDLGAMVLEALASVERQTRPAHEIVVVDDRSTDAETQAILGRIAQGGTCVVSGPGRGASAARNLGVRMTSADYIVWLDGDDTLEPGYFAAAAERLDTNASIDFVTCAMHAFGEANYYWKPSPPRFVDAVATGGVPHASTMVRRGLWTAVGGFDEDVRSFELLDFWGSALERGFRGVILDQPFINYRIRRDSGYRRSIEHETYQARMRHFYAKHRRSVEAHGDELLAAKEAFFLSQRNYWRGLETKVAALETELASLNQQIADAARELEFRGQTSDDLATLRHLPQTGGLKGAPPQAAAGGPESPRRIQSARPAQATILAYHRVAALAPDSHGLCLPPSVFRDHMTYLRRHCTPMALDELVRAAASGSIPDRAVAVTLDDGYFDALTAASPILTELGIPATFFVNSDRLDTLHERWFDVLERLFLGDAKLPARLSLDVAGNRVELPTATAAERAAALKSLNGTMWPQDARTREKLIADVAAWRGLAPPPRDSHRVLTAGELRELAQRPGHTIGSHTVNHLALSTQPPETKRREMIDDRAALERVLGRAVTLFSYPYGDLDADTVHAAAEAGFVAAVTIESGRVTSGTNRLLLPRCEVTPLHHDRLALLLEEALAV